MADLNNEKLPEQVSDKKGDTNDKKVKAKNAKPNFFVRFGRRAKRFWKEYVSELKKVVWMSWKDVRKNTLLVVSATVLFSVAIGVVDTTFREIFKGLADLIG